MTRRRAAALLVGCLSVMAGCGTTDSPGSASSAAPPPPTVVVTHPALADLVEVVSGGTIEPASLLGRGTDPHTAAATADGSDALAGADLVVAVGLGLEGGLVDELGRSREAGVEVFEVGPSLAPGDPPDPHIWLDPDRMTQAGRLVGDRLVALGADRGAVAAGTEAWRRELLRADEAVQALLGPLPDEARRVATAEPGALGYWADRYGLTVVDLDDDAAVVLIDRSRSGPPATEPPGGPEPPGGAERVVFLDNLGPRGSGAGDVAGLLRALAGAIAGVPPGPPSTGA